MPQPINLNNITSNLKEQFTAPITDAGYEYNKDVGLGSSFSEYRSKVMPTGVSRLGKDPLEGEVWNPGSITAEKWFMDNAGTYASIDPDYYKNSFLPTYEKLRLAKTDKERFSILEDAQGKRQTSFATKYPKLAVKVGGSYAGTQLGLQKLYDNLPSTDKKEFETALKESGIPLKNGKVLGGHYQVKGDRENDALSNYLDKIKQDKPELYDTYSIGNITEGKWDRRLENFQWKDFYSVNDREKYFTPDKFDKVEDAGKVFYVDKENPNNIIEARVFRDKKVPLDELNKWKEKDSQFKFGENNNFEYKNLGESGVYERHYSEEQPKEEVTPVAKTEEEKKTDGAEAKFSSANIRKALGVQPKFYQRPPSSLTIFPEYLPKVEKLDTVKVTPEEAIRENNRALELSTQALSYDTSDATGANLAQLQERTMIANNQAVMKAEEINAQNQLNVDNQNVQLGNQQEILKSNYIKSYNDQVARAMLNTENELSSYEKADYNARMKQLEEQEKLRIYEAMYPNLKYLQGNGLSVEQGANEFYVPSQITNALYRQKQQEEANRKAEKETKQVITKQSSK